MRRSGRDEAAVLLRLPRRIQPANRRFRARCPRAVVSSSIVQRRNGAAAGGCSLPAAQLGSSVFNTLDVSEPPTQGLHSGVCTTCSAMQSALLHLEHLRARPDYTVMTGLLLLHSMHSHVRHADLGPLRRPLHTLSPPPQATSRLSRRRKSGRAARYPANTLRAIRHMLGPRHPFAVLDRPRWEDGDAETS